MFYTMPISRRNVNGRSHISISIILFLLLLQSALVQCTPAAIFRRQSNSTCPTGQSQCPQSSVSQFCCPTDNDCIPLAKDTTVACCPKGSDCRRVQPLVCMDGLDDKKQTRCGDSGSLAGKCCPGGY